MKETACNLSPMLEMSKMNSDTLLFVISIGESTTELTACSKCSIIDTVWEFRYKNQMFKFFVLTTFTCTNPSTNTHNTFDVGTLKINLLFHVVFESLLV